MTNDFHDIKIFKKDRLSYIFLEKCKIDVKNGAFVVYDKTSKVELPIANISVIFLQPGISITHAAICLAAKTETMLIFVGEEGVRYYSFGSTQNTKSYNLIKQVDLYSSKKLEICKKMYSKMFSDIPNLNDFNTIEQMRGYEGMRVKAYYHSLSKQYKLTWHKRDYIVNNHDLSDPINKCLSTANSCLYGIVESAIIALGMSPALGFIHSGTSKSLVYDISDIIKFQTVVPIAFEIASSRHFNFDYETRISCRNFFKTNNTMSNLFDIIKEIFDI